MNYRRFVQRGATAFSVLALMSTVTLVAPSGADSGIGATPTIVCCGGGSPTWAVDDYGDSTSLTASSLSSLITELHGTPSSFGVYLDHGTSSILTSSVVSVLHNASIPMNLIEDSYTTAESSSGGLMTSTEGAADATSAATRAHNNLGAPENGTIVIYRDIEPGESVTSAYITGYFNQLSNYHFIPGFYENPTSGDFSSAFCSTTSTIENGSVQWASEPEETPTTLSQFYDGAQPAWNAYTPSCTSTGATVYAWQYIEAKGIGPVDDDLASALGTW